MKTNINRVLHTLFLLSVIFNISVAQAETTYPRHSENVNAPSQEDLSKYKYVYIIYPLQIYRIREQMYSQFKYAIATHLSNLGLRVIDENQLESMEVAGGERRYVMECNFYLNIDYPGQLIIYLTDIFHRKPFLDLQSSCKNIRSYKKITQAVEDAFQNIGKITFKPWELSKKDLPKPNCSSWSEDSIKSYLSCCASSSIEGIYKRKIDSFEYFQKLAIIKEGNCFYGIAMYDDWYTHKGDVVLSFNFLERETYDARFFYRFYYLPLIETETFETDRYAIAYLDKYNRILTIKDGDLLYGEYLKTYGNQERSDMNKSGNLSTGSGIILNDGIIATNFHVIEGASQIDVTYISDGVLKTCSANLLCADKANDLALITINGNMHNKNIVTPYKIVSDIVDTGTSVFTMGYPMADILGKEVKVTDGMISSKTGYNGDVVTYQISAPIQPGNSGGALFDKKGNLIGITNAGIKGADNVGYAIKSPYLINLIKSTPINIKIAIGKDERDKDLTQLIKQYTPYVVYIKANK